MNNNKMKKKAKDTSTVAWLVSLFPWRIYFPPGWDAGPSQDYSFLSAEWIGAT